MNKHAVFTLCLFLAAAPAAAFAKDAPRTISLTGRGEVRAAPDLAIITLGVVKQAATARAALMANTQAMTAIFSLLKSKWKLADKDMQTSGFSISPQYVYPKVSYDRDRGPKLVGYRVSNMLTIRLHDLKKTGGVLDDVVRSGSNRINGVSFTIAHPAPLRDEARRKAVRDALRKARLYAKEAGFELGPVLRFSENGGFAPPPRPVMMARSKAMMADSAPVPVAAGEQSVRVTVSITWEIR